MQLFDLSDQVAIVTAIAPAGIETQGIRGMWDDSLAAAQPVGRFGAGDDVR